MTTETINQQAATSPSPSIDTDAITASIGDNLEANIEQVSKLADTLIEFGIQYGFQILGALVFLLIGLRVANFAGRRVMKLCEKKEIDVTLSKFIGSMVKIVLVVMLVIITLGNFGISIAPLIALAGAGAFGATMAIQGPLSNYGAGLSIILSRPFTVGSTIQVSNVSGIVEEVTLAHTRLRGEDGELITIPNKQIVGEVIVNSDQMRIVESKIALAQHADTEKAALVVVAAINKLPAIKDGTTAQAGILDFTYGGMILGLRAWVPSRTYFANRFAVNKVALEALREAGIPLMEPVSAAIVSPDLTSAVDMDYGRPTRPDQS